ncbi:hypothetical protein [Halomonas cupida]|uniref:hypothetical protein n=1 Tax=Halomonas cupida TaxID=44933 RepID=UPI003A8E9E3A
MISHESSRQELLTLAHQLLDRVEALRAEQRHAHVRQCHEIHTPECRSCDYQDIQLMEAGRLVYQLSRVLCETPEDFAEQWYREHAEEGRDHALE